MNKDYNIILTYFPVNIEPFIAKTELDFCASDHGAVGETTLFVCQRDGFLIARKLNICCHFYYWSGSEKLEIDRSFMLFT